MSNKTIQILYFASLAEKAGRDEEMLSVDERATLGEIYGQLKDKYQFDLAQNELAIAINHHIGNWQLSVKQGDVVAFIPPVAGG